MADEVIYTAITFAPVQGFIEKSRKLRDLYGASEILSHLSKSIVDAANEHANVEVISPGLIEVEKGMPNRILLKGDFPERRAKDTLLASWKEVTEHCRIWVDDNLRQLRPYHWGEEWVKWANHSWEIFWAQGKSPRIVMEELETRKLRRQWTAVNWIGESSSLTGADAIAFPRLGAKDRNPKFISYGDEKSQIETFYQRLAEITESTTTPKVEGKFIDPSEKLSIPELTKRLVTWPPIAQRFRMESLDKGFKDIQRKPTETTPSQWTGWFMGDGDKVGDYLIHLSENENDDSLKRFTHAMREWGQDFADNFPRDKGRVIYAGGDDFLGVIYSENPNNPIPAFTAYEWLITLPNKWREHQQPIEFSLGFVWVAGSVPQRDVLQHCREAEKVAKNLGRNRVTIRVVFNSGQYVQWTCPWDYLHILKQYRDRDGKTYSEWECRGRDKNYLPNWSHVYSDLAQLKARHGINLNIEEDRADETLALALFDVYFNQKDYLTNNAQDIVGKDSPLQIIHWINNLINVGWQLCSDI